MVIYFFRWWYGEGIKKRLALLQLKLGKMMDTFSISLFLRTLFKPFKLIDANRTGQSLEDKMRASFDKFFSRMIGFFARLSMIIVGSLVIGFRALFGMFELVFWLTMPALPFICFALAALGVAPKWK